MPNTFAFVTGWMAMESLRILQNKLVIASGFNTDQQKEYEQLFAVGDTTLKKFPQRFVIRDGQGYTPQGFNRKTTPIVVDQNFGIDFEWDSVEQALKMERSEAWIKKEYLEPAMTQMAQELDSRASKFAYQNTNNISGVLGTVPTAMQTYGRGRTLLMENSCQPGERMMVVTPSMMEAVVAANEAKFAPNDEISEGFKEGNIGRYAGSKWYESMSLYSHTAGTWAGAVTVTSSGQSGTSILITATAGDTFLKGDVISFAATNNVNPSTRRSTGRAKTFVVTQDLTAAGGGADALQILPAIVGPGDQYQNVDALPLAAAALTLFPGTSSPNGKVGVSGLNFQRDAFALVGVEMPKPDRSVEMSWQRKDPQTGHNIRFIRQWDNRTNSMTNRFDYLGGFGALYQDNCSVRILSLT